MENKREIPRNIEGIEIIPVDRVQDAWELVFSPEELAAPSRLDEQFPPLARKPGIHRLTS